MSTDTTTTGLVTTISETAARVSFALAAAFVVLLASLHFLEPEFDPSWRFISEYELGRYGWAMRLAFFSLAASYISLAIAIHSQLRFLVGRIGLALLLISALGLAMAGIFKTDPITTSPDAATTIGMLHSVGGSLGIAMTFSAAIVSWQLARIPAWALARRPLLWTAGIAVVCPNRIHYLSGDCSSQRRQIRPGCICWCDWAGRDHRLQRVVNGSRLASDQDAQARIIDGFNKCEQSRIKRFRGKK